MQSSRSKQLRDAIGNPTLCQELGAVDGFERGRSDNPTRWRICDAQNDAATTFVGKGAAGAYQVLEVVTVLGLLELDMLRLTVESQGFQEVRLSANDHRAMCACRGLAAAD